MARLRRRLPYRLRRSAIAGRGLFASRPIVRGEWIVEYKGERITDAEADRRSPPLQAGEQYHTVFFAVAPDVVIDAGVRGNSARFINHSCDPNCRAAIEGTRVQIYARRRIAEGEELSFDYSYLLEDRFSPAMRAAHPCHCGSVKCRGTLFG
jgi:SET domain-containing protein